jgi:pimeloyl-ACP methyl ester carboxylesterase
MFRPSCMPRDLGALLGLLLVAQPLVAQESVGFKTGDGGYISADLYGTGARGVVLAHGYRFSKESWEPQASTLTKQGFQVLAIDFRGYGESKGPGQADPLNAPLHHDVLAAVRYLRERGAMEVSVVGASMGAEASARASSEARSGEIDRLVLLAGGVGVPAAQLKGRKLFVVAQGDLDSTGSSRLGKIREAYNQASEPKDLLILEGSAHAQALFSTEAGDQLLRDIVSFLSVKEPCDRQCLLDGLANYLDAVSHLRPELVPLSPNAVVRENTRNVQVGAGVWRSVAAIRSQQVFADALSGNVVARIGAQLDDGRIAYVSTRLKIVGSVIVEVETSFDSSEHVVAPNVIALDPILSTIVPEEARSTRAELEAIGRSYFQALSDHKPVASEFDTRCDRYHSGQRVTNNAANSVEQAGPRTCVESFAGPWGPAIEHRFPVIDPERGIIVGYTLLIFPNGQQMYVSEVFKILDGRIRLIDNIGVMMAGVETTGFSY